MAGADAEQQANSRYACQYDSTCSIHLMPHLDLLQMQPMSDPYTGHLRR